MTTSLPDARPASADADPVRAYLSLGSNVGAALDTLLAAVRDLDDVAGVAVADVSGVYRTTPWGETDQPDFLNLAAAVDTALDPRSLLAVLHDVERRHGRDRSAERRWGPRPLDIDLLLHGDAVVAEPGLEVPHPRMTERAFVLVPLFEIMPGGRLPDGSKLTTHLQALAPIEGIDLVVRRSDLPGTRHRQRPDGPAGPGAVPAEAWHADARERARRFAVRDWRPGPPQP